MKNTTSKEAPLNRRRTLAGSLAIWLSLIVTGIITLLGVVYFFITVTQAQNDLSQQATRRVEELANVLSIPTWNLDKAAIKQIASSYQIVENVASIHVTDDIGDILYESVSDEPDLIVETRPILYNGKKVGDVELSLSTKQITQLRRSILLQVFSVLIVVLVTIIVATWLLLQRLLGAPLAALTKGIQRFADGDYNLRLPPLAQDELNAIVEQFNTMASHIQTRDQVLEERVAERTAKMERRNLDLALAAEVGQTVSQVRDINGILKDAAEIMRAFFGLYYVQFYLVSPDGKELLLQMGTGTVGEQLVSRGHRLPLDEQSINGRAAITKRSVVIADTASSPTFRPNPLLPNTRSEIAVPLLAGNNLVGVLDAQSEKSGFLNEETLLAFEPMAGQIAVAIQNSRLVAETQQARTEVEALARRLTRQGWGEYLDAIHKPEEAGFVYEHNQVSPLSAAKGRSMAENALVAPIAVTGAQVGNLVVEMSGESPIARTEELVNAIARQVAEHLESLRLLESAERYRAEAEEASRRATREGWRDYTQKSSQTLSYIYNLKEVLPLNESKQDQSATRLPLKIRDQIIGSLAIQGLNQNDSEAIELINAVAERLSTHIESLRLTRQTEEALEATRQFGEREQALRQITSAVRGSTDPATILRTAVRELGNLLGRKAVIRMAATSNENKPILPTESQKTVGGDQ
jgi:GAF domain-containing protein